MKGYWIAHVTVHDLQEYTRYTELAPAAFKQFNATLLARGGRYQQLEGDDNQRHVIIEFPSYDTALNCYHSENYQLAASFRQHIATAHITIVEGL
ncbi:DUF1330 domain-containing protein [Photobacterium frigidiphilum]|uniref:DUF1330 domain-containing protein n=1 Tax=Photobacterium frigidiphilum TaxID=264736 RepID=UPI003D0C1811